MMGSDIELDAIECEVHRAGIIAMRQRAAELRAELCASRGLTLSQGCQLGCSTCGVADASPARCEQCTGVHSAAERGCRCGPDGCSDSSCPGRVTLVGHLPADDAEGCAE